MYLTSDDESLNPRLTHMLRRFAPLLVVGAVLFGSLGYITGTARSDRFHATASLVLRDVQAQTIFDPVFAQAGNVNPERYANNQLAILASSPVARRAAGLLGFGEADESVEKVLASTRLEREVNSDVITIEYSAETESGAIDGANAVLQSYLETVEDQLAAAFQVVLAELDEAVALATADVNEIDGRVSAAGMELDQQLDQLVLEFLDLSDRLSNAPEANRPTLRAELANLAQQIGSFQTVRTVADGRAGLLALRERLNEAVQRESALMARRNEVVADAQIPRSDLAVVSRAVLAEPNRTGVFISTAAGVILGLVIAGALAFRFSQRPAATDV